MTGTDPYRRLRELEVAWGDVPGFESAPSEASPTASASPRAALEGALRPALLRTPCLVAFSGGRDSSAVLATATVLARRLGLNDPVPVTRCHRGSAADESEWQELLVGHLGLSEWIRIDADIDLVGPTGAAGLARTGVLWPPLIHHWAPLFAEAAGGTLLTGEGGDEVFGLHRSRLAAALLERRGRSGRALAADAARSLQPGPVRRRRAYQEQPPRPWLRPDAQVALDRAVAADQAAEPWSWAAGLGRLGHRRSTVIGSHNLSMLARQHDTVLGQPLLDPGFLAALGAAAPRLGYTSRTQAMASVFGDLLPPALLARTGKVFLNQVVFGPATREWAGRWDGRGLPDQLVDTGALRREWSGEDVHAGTALLLQTAWLAGQ